MRQIKSLIWKEWLLLARDRQATAVLFLMPMIFIFILSIALQDVFSDKSNSKVTLQIISEKESKEFADSLKSKLIQMPQIDVIDENSSISAKARLKVTSETAKAFSKLSRSNFSAAQKPSQSMEIWLDPTLNPAYRWFVKVSLSNALYQLVLEKAQGNKDETNLKDPLAFINDEGIPKTEKMNLADFLKEEKVEAGRIVPTSLQQNVPGWSLFAMFFIAIPLASGILKERQDGTIKRLLTLPVTKTTLILGKLIPYVTVNLLQFVSMLLIGLYVIPLCTELKFQLGNDSQFLIPVTLICALTATSYGIFISSVSQSVEQASALSAGLVICMAALGGIMVPLFAMPLFMQEIAKISPLYWGHQAYLDVLVREVPFSVIAPKLGVLLAFALVLLSIGKRRFQWL